MDKEKVMAVLNNIWTVIKLTFQKFKYFCNKHTFATSMILLGAFMLALNLTLSNSLGMAYYPLILGFFFLVLHGLYNRNHYFSFVAAHMMSIGIFIILLLTDLLPQGGDSSIIFFVGLGFLVFYAIEAKWMRYWPLIPGFTITLFGGLLYLHTTDSVRMSFIVLIGKYWPIAIVVFGIVSLFVNPLKSFCHRMIKKINV